MRSWIARVRHDLVNRLLWPARDRRDLGGAVVPGELRPQLIDEEGTPADVATVWSALKDEAPAGLALADFERALAEAERAALADDLPGLLALDDAFEALARSVKDV